MSLDHTAIENFHDDFGPYIEVIFSGFVTFGAVWLGASLALHAYSRQSKIDRSKEIDAEFRRHFAEMLTLADGLMKICKAEEPISDLEYENEWRKFYRLVQLTDILGEQEVFRKSDDFVTAMLILFDSRKGQRMTKEVVTDANYYEALQSAVEARIKLLEAMKDRVANSTLIEGVL